MTAPDKPLANWTPPRFPDAVKLEGRYAGLALLSPHAHAAPLFAANSTSDHIWDYLPYGPFETESAYRGWIEAITAGDDPRFYAIFNKDAGAWQGVASYLRIQPAAGSIEVGHINLSPALQKTRAATEAMYLMMKWAFDAGYRRYEWKCDAANLGSRRAAQRLGLSFEGIFRQAGVVKGRNRDTAWFAAIDNEWPALEQAFETWLAPANFDPNGRQRKALGALTAPVLVARDPALGA